MGMTQFLSFGRGGVIDAHRILAILSARSTPTKRLLAKTDPNRILNLTYGYPRESVILLEGGYFAIVTQTIEQLSHILESQRIDSHEQTTLIQRTAQS